MHRPISGCELEEPNHFSFPLPSDPEHRHGNVSPRIRLGLSLDYLITGIGTTIHVYALPDFRHIHSLACEDGTLIQALEIHNDILVTASENVLVPNDTIRVWDLVSGTCLCSVPHPEHDVDEFFVMSIYKPETEVSAAEEHGRESLSKMAMYRLHDPILSIWALANSSYEAAKIIEQDVDANPFLLSNIQARNHDISSVMVKGRRALTGGLDDVVRLWDIVTGECKLVLIGPTGQGNFLQDPYF
ncbi:hypothetical protein CVT26_012432 [Gymnopilus dilepis]|uniref:Uncharacterized protein n=1 Tax=Gymnopilus dilepis TaxID=231916 RepID=A0A409YWA8_9AGAR|nr:hypothetical protein CVT26_012432 [Gymnopilus dilepis]